MNPGELRGPVFRAVPMMRLHAVVLAQDERVVLKGLGQLGAVHLTHTQSGPDTAPLAPTDRSHREFTGPEP